MPAFLPNDTVVLTSTTSSQTTTVPNGAVTMVAFNGAANPVYMKWGASVAAPNSTWGDADGINVMVLQPTTTQAFDVPRGGGTLAYIAVTAGGVLALSVGSGI